jgi:hypothetical protein
LFEYLKLESYLCPESGDIDYNGVAGSQFWVVPKSDSAEFDIRTDPTPYLRNSVDIQMITKDFGIEEYL